jgi:hypothetical protein
MKLTTEIHWRRLPVAKEPADLQRVVDLLHCHAIPTEEGLHRPWRSACFEPALMVASEDYPRALALAGDLLLGGKGARVLADCTREVVDPGRISRNIHARERVGSRSETALTGDVTTQRMNIGDGAFFMGVIDTKPGQ